MRRSFPVVPLVFAATAAVVASVAPACGDECNRAEDCESGEVCYKGVCTPLSAEYVSCQTNADCDPSGDFLCRNSRCTLKPTTSAPDSGVPRDGGSDAGGGGAPDAGGGGAPDAGGGGGGGDAGVAQFSVTRRAMQATFPTNQAHLVTATNTLVITGTSVRGEVVTIRVLNPASAATFTCAASQVSIEYQFSGTEIFAAGPSDTCSVFLDLFGAVGTTIRGTFQGTLAQTVGGTGTLTLTDGMFGTMRGADQ